MPKETSIIYRHSFVVRIAHWINAIALIILVMSGFQIFNAHSSLYWGDRSDRDNPFFTIKNIKSGEGKTKGETVFLDHSFDTTGFLGVSTNKQGEEVHTAFPDWLTIPGPQWLAMGRRWHFFFAWLFVFNGLFFILYSLVFGHLKRDLFPSFGELKQIGKSFSNHLLFRHPKGEEAAHYNVIQKVAYTGVVLVLAPLILLTGLSMSPGMDAAFPWLPALFGGRQSARSVHFMVCFFFVGFFFIHIFMVMATGLWNNLRSMITGRYKITSKLN
ncbi:MAG: cytochrome b/b6 domain-containing protein [Nitrospiria bacterium]